MTSRLLLLLAGSLIGACALLASYGFAAEAVAVGLAAVLFAHRSGERNR
jgi:hypothetical protein